MVDSYDDEEFPANKHSMKVSFQDFPTLRDVG